MEQEFKTVADRLKQIRLNRNYSQDYLAKKIGVSQKAYSKIENNETRLNVDTLALLAQVLETPVADFFDESERPILNDFSSRSGGDNVIYKNEASKETDATVYQQLLSTKDDLINSKDAEIRTLNLLIQELKK